MHRLQAGRGTPVARRRLWAITVVSGVIALDQLTKSLVVATIARGDRIVLIDGWFQLSHLRNTGAAFGILRGFGGLIALVAIVGLAVIGFIVLRDPSPTVALGASLVAGGATGNILDRLFRGPVGRGGVVDFLDASFWPAFNVADAAITVGAVVVILFGARDQAT